MAKTLRSCKFAYFFLILITSSLQILITQSRPIKPKVEIPVSSSNADDFQPTDPGYSPCAGHSKKPVTSSNVEDSVKATKPVAVGNKENLHQKKLTETVIGSTTNDFRPTSPSYSPGVGHPKTVVFANSNIESTASTRHANSDVARKNYHLVQNNYKLTEANTGSIPNGFRPTAPGYSPGVRHPKTVVTSSNVEKSSTGSTANDFRPTTPGYSPGFGHPKELKVINSDDINDYRPTHPGHSPGVGHKNGFEPNP